MKLCHDFLTTAKKDDNLQNILQVVENNRNQLPNQKKRTMSSKNWFLKLQLNVYSIIFMFYRPPIPPSLRFIYFEIEYLLKSGVNISFWDKFHRKIRFFWGKPLINF